MGLVVNGIAALFCTAGHLMDISIVREALHRQPFEPFAIRLAGGRSLPVKHPDFVALGTRRVFYVAEDDSTFFIEPLLIVSLDTEAKPPKGSNGSHRRKPKS